MEKEYLERYIELLTKIKESPDEITWGEMNELRSLDYKVSDFIQEEWHNW